MPSLFNTDALFADEPTAEAPLRPDAADAQRAQGTDTARLRARGSGCASPALGCNRTAYTVAGGDGYLQRGYDSGRWWMK